MLILKWAAAALFVVSIPLFLVLSNVRIAAMEPRVYEYSFAEYGAEITTGIDRAQLDFAARDIVNYFQNDEELLTTQVRVGGQEQPLFTERETLHMKDVKGLFNAVFFIQEVAFVYAVAYVTTVFLWSRERSLRTLGQLCLVAGVGTAGLLMAAAVGLFVGFDDLFRQFHLLSFSNDFWELDPARDHLIQMFPRDFWFDVSLAVGVASVLEGLLVALAGFAILSWVNRSAARLRLRERSERRARRAAADA
jgi:integral membrane protein (TIGR01906 family)